MFYLLCKHQWITTSFHFNSFCTVKGAIYYEAIATVICSHAKISCFRAKASRVEKYFTRSLHSLEKYVSTREEKFLILCGHVAHIYISHALVKGQNYWALIGWERGKYCCNQERVWKLCDFLNLDNNRYGPKENFAKICKIKWNWIRSVKFEIVRKDF